MLLLCTHVWETLQGGVQHLMSRIMWLSKVTFCLLFFTLTEWSFICLRSPVKQYMCFLEVDCYFRIRTRPFRISVWIKRTKRTNQKDVSYTHTHTLCSMHIIIYSSEFSCITYDVINHVSFKFTTLKPRPTKYLSSSNLSTQTCTKTLSGS